MSMSQVKGQVGKAMIEAAREWEGQVVNGKFPLRQYLGGSDQSAVFLTHRGEHEAQKAVIKLIPAIQGKEELQLSRWEMGAKLFRSNLIRIFEMGRCQLGESPLLYVVEEYAEEDLSQVLPERPLTPAEARDMLEAVLAALSHIHRQGLVHGHLKPLNIMALGDQIKVSSDGLCATSESRTGFAFTYNCLRFLRQTGPL